MHSVKPCIADAVALQWCAECGIMARPVSVVVFVPLMFFSPRMRFARTLQPAANTQQAKGRWSDSSLQKSQTKKGP